MKRMPLSALKSSAMMSLSREQMKNVMGGTGGSDDEGFPGGGEGKLCMGCSTDQECAAVGKGSCTYYGGCGSKCCSGWQSC